MMSGRRAVAAVGSLVLLAMGAFAADIAGKWTTEFDTPIGTLHYTYEFQVDGATLTGTATWDQGSSAIKDGKVAGNEISFVEDIEIQGQQIRISYKGKLTGNEIHLTREVGEFATEEIVLKRAE